MSLGPSYIHDLVCNAGRYSPVGSAGCSCASRVPTFPLMTVEQLQAQIATLTAENKRLREALAIAATWTAEPGVTIAEIRAALQPKEGE